MRILVLFTLFLNAYFTTYGQLNTQVHSNLTEERFVHTHQTVID